MNIGIIGIGNMGLAMATRLRHKGWTLAVRDIDAARERSALALGVRVCASAAELAQCSDLVIVCVVDARQAQGVLFDPGNGVVAQYSRPCVMLCPTIGPDEAQAIAKQLEEHGMACIEAPMSGGPVRAAAGQMSLMVACEEGLFEHWSALLGSLADPVFRIGQRIGDGARTKLVNNLLAAINLAGAAEALALAERVGLDPARTLDVIERSSGQSWIGSERLRRALADDLAPRAHMSLLDKDAALALAMARTAGYEVRVGESAAALFSAACASGMASLDDASLFSLLRGAAPPAC